MDDEKTPMAPVLHPGSSKSVPFESGMGPSRTIPSTKHLAWKKLAIQAAVLIGLASLWFFVPRDTGNLAPWRSDKENVQPKLPPGSTVDTSVPSTPAQPTPTPSKPSTSSTHPTSYETDHHPSKTTHCTFPHSPSFPLVQYAIIIDAGSTGSRIHIYKFNNCGPSPSFEYEVFKRTSPALHSSYHGSPNNAARTLDVLLDKAQRVVPQAMWSRTPVAVKVSAGMRVLPGPQSTNILDAVRTRLRERYPFALNEVVIVDARDTGVYEWITANYLLDTLRIRADSPGDAPTHALLSLGLGLTQIVFEPTFSKSDQELRKGEQRVDLTLGGRTHVMYEHSHRGYGLMHVRRNVHQLVDSQSSDSIKPGTATDGIVILNPCLARGTRKAVEFGDTRAEWKSVTMDGGDVGGFEACNRVIELVMAKDLKDDAICEVKPCSFNGDQLSLMDTLPSRKVLLLYHFYDRISSLLPPSSSSASFNITTISTLAQRVCTGRPSWLKHWGANAEVMRELQDSPEWCLDLTFIYKLLKDGPYGVDEGMELVVGKEIDGRALGWYLGAAIAMLDGDLSQG